MKINFTTTLVALLFIQFQALAQGEFKRATYFDSGSATKICPVYVPEDSIFFLGSGYAFPISAIDFNETRCNCTILSSSEDPKAVLITCRLSPNKAFKELSAKESLALIKNNLMEKWALSSLSTNSNGFTVFTWANLKR